MTGLNPSNQTNRSNVSQYRIQMEKMHLRVERMPLLVTGFIRQISSTSEPKPIIDLIFEFYKRSSFVMDFGSGYSKVGFAGDDGPKEVFPTIIARKWSQRQHVNGAKEKKDIYFVGDEARAKRGIPPPKHPVQDGIICNWNDMEAIMRYAFTNALEISSKGRAVLMAEAPLNPKVNREKITQVMFESFEVNRFCLKMQSCLALYASGRTTGIVVDSGYGVTHTVPVYEGSALNHAIQRMDHIAGRRLTEYLMWILTERGYSLTTSAEREIARNIKETMAYVAYDYEHEMRKSQTSSEIEQDYELPDGQIITIGNERFRCAEPLFRPSFIGFEQPGIHDLVYNSILKCNVEHDIRKILCSNIVLDGGSTMFPGFGQRLKKEVVRKVPHDYDVNVIKPPDANNSVWIGGSIFITMEDVEEMWITKEDYDEYGAAIVHQKCV
eukprot:522382_1